MIMTYGLNKVHKIRNEHFFINELMPTIRKVRSTISKRWREHGWSMKVLTRNLLSIGLDG